MHTSTVTCMCVLCVIVTIICMAIYSPVIMMGT